MNNLSVEFIQTITTKTEDIIKQYQVILSALQEIDLERKSFEAERGQFTEQKKTLSEKEKYLTEKESEQKQKEKVLTIKQAELSELRLILDKRKEILTEEVKRFALESEQKKESLLALEKTVTTRQEALKGLAEKEVELQTTKQRLEEERMLIEKEKKIDKERKAHLDMREQEVIQKEERVARLLNN